MSWLASIGIALLTGILGLLCGGFLGNACVRWYRISGFEGGSGYAVIAIALVGGIVGLVVGLVASRIVAAGAGPGFLKGLGSAWGAALALAALITSICWAFADIPPAIDGHELMLEVEIKLPVGVTNSPALGVGESHLNLGSLSGHTQRKAHDGMLNPAAARLEDGRWIVPGEVLVFTMRGKRALDIELNGEQIQGFMVPLPARPGKRFEEWSQWGPRPPAGMPPWPDSKPSYRFRVRQILPPPPGPPPEDHEAKGAAEQRARFDAMKPDAPITEWMRFTVYGTPEDQVAAAISHIVGRTNFIGEWMPLVLGEDAEQAGELLKLVTRMPDPSSDLVPPMQAIGRDLAERIRKVNATTVEQDPSYLAAADVSIRFSWWMEAARFLRDKNGSDFAPELKVILELSRLRPDSHSMSGSVCRVASYWMQQWTGLEPLPTDPKPR
jgi:hypothetical protein